MDTSESRLEGGGDGEGESAFDFCDPFPSLLQDPIFSNFFRLSFFSLAAS